MRPLFKPNMLGFLVQTACFTSAAFGCCGGIQRAFPGLCQPTGSQYRRTSIETLSPVHVCVERRCVTARRQGELPFASVQGDKTLLARFVRIVLFHLGEESHQCQWRKYYLCHFRRGPASISRIKSNDNRSRCTGRDFGIKFILRSAIRKGQAFPEISSQAR